MLPISRFSYSSVALGLFGLLFCLWVDLSGGDTLCITDGCTLFRDFSLLGIPLWRAGEIFFSAEIILCLLKKQGAAQILAAMALCADTLLFTLMTVTAPCANCLIAGLFMLLLYLSLIRGKSILACVWGIAFICNLGSVVKDECTPWQMGSIAEPPSVQVFFSPSCPACQTLLAKHERLTGAAWYPVPENRRDVWLIFHAAEEMKKGAPMFDALAEVEKKTPPKAEFEKQWKYRWAMLNPKILLFRFRLWKNHAHVLSVAEGRLPFVKFLGIPSFVLKENHEKGVSSAESKQSKASATSSSSKNKPFSSQHLEAVPELSDGMTAGFCDGTKPEPCDATKGEGKDLLPKNIDSGIKKESKEKGSLQDAMGDAFFSSEDKKNEAERP